MLSFSGGISGSVSFPSKVDEAKNIGNTNLDRETGQSLILMLTDEQITQQVAEMQAQLHTCAQTGRAYRLKWRDVKAIIETITTLRERLAQAKAWQMDVEEREAAVCPEDVPFDEYIRHLEKHRADLEHDFNEAVKQANAGD